MAERHLTFHVPQEAEPSTLIPLLEAVNAEQAEFDTVASLLDFAQQHGLMSRAEINSFASDCGLLQKDQVKGIGLSEAALWMLQLKPETRPDVVHYIIYSGWQAERPLDKTVLWSYRQVVDLLWRQPGADISKISNVIAEEIRNQIQETFESDPSFSPKSIRGVRKWLEALTPPVIENDIFTRRYFCPPELALLALGWVGQTLGGEVGIDFLLTLERREAVCRVCLLDPAALDRVLDWTLPLYPAVVRPGTGAGVYGRFIRFLKWPELQDLLR
ncbi:MAG: hypothetical protein JXR84_20080 [Anaerolineae bacterium]|nr:hypothetical protein [Anaerolineae bacterium]